MSTRPSIDAALPISALLGNNITKLPTGALPGHPPAQGPGTLIELKRLERDGLLAAPTSQTPLARAFRHAKRPLMENLLDPGCMAERRGLIMVTSALNGEGKTFCALNLALSLAAEIDTEVLLVDADVVRPELMRRLGVHPERGLLDLLVKPGLALDEVVLATNVPKLSLLGAGTPHALSTELLASEAMDRLLASLAARGPGRLVVFDGPPLLPTSEAQVLASRVGQVVLVVEASRTPRGAVQQALELLQACPLVLPLLNKTRQAVMPPSYGQD